MTENPTPSQTSSLDSPESRQALFDAIVEHKGIKPACRALGIPASKVFLKARVDPKFQDQLRAAQATNLERLVDECIEIADNATKDTWAVARLQIETRMRIAGKLIPAIYGDKPATQVNVQTNIGVVCDEATRQRLSDLRAKLVALTPGILGYSAIPDSLSEAP